MFSLRLFDIGCKLTLFTITSILPIFFFKSKKQITIRLVIFPCAHLLSNMLCLILISAEQRPVWWHPWCSWASVSTIYRPPTHLSTSVLSSSSSISNSQHYFSVFKTLSLHLRTCSVPFSWVECGTRLVEPSSQRGSRWTTVKTTFHWKAKKTRKKIEILLPSPFLYKF